MKDIYLENFAYPCVSYVKMRTGSCCSIEQLLSMPCNRYTATTILEKGDVVVWRHNMDIKITDVMLTIGEHGVITTKARFDRHFGVYEGGGFVSDLTFDNDNHHPRIRLMQMSEHPTPREFIRNVDVAAGRDNR